MEHENAQTVNGVSQAKTHALMAALETTVKTDHL
jgi:hypothetical protein